AFWQATSRELRRYPGRRHPLAPAGSRPRCGAVGVGRKLAARGRDDDRAQPAADETACLRADHADCIGTGCAAGSPVSLAWVRTRRGSANRPRNTATRAPTAYHKVAPKVRAKLCALASSPALVSSVCSSRCCAAGSARCADLVWQLAGTLVGSVAADLSCTQARKPVMIWFWAGAGIAPAVSSPRRAGVTAGTPWPAPPARRPKQITPTSA